MGCLVIDYKYTDYILSWTQSGAHYTRTFDSAEAREKFVREFLPTCARDINCYERETTVYKGVIK